MGSEGAGPIRRPNSRTNGRTWPGFARGWPWWLPAWPPSGTSDSHPILGYVVAAAIVVTGLATIVLLLRADPG